MMELADDIIETNHCVDDECPVNDLVKEANSLLFPSQDFSQIMQAAAIDTYHKILEETGDVKKAEDAFFQIHSDYYGQRN